MAETRPVLLFGPGMRLRLLVQLPTSCACVHGVYSVVCNQQISCVNIVDVCTWAYHRLYNHCIANHVPKAIFDLLQWNRHHLEQKIVPYT